MLVANPPNAVAVGRHAEEHPRDAHPEGDHVVGEAAPRPEHRARREHRQEADRARLEPAGRDPEHERADRDAPARGRWPTGRRPPSASPGSALTAPTAPPRHAPPGPALLRVEGAEAPHEPVAGDAVEPVSRERALEERARGVRASRPHEETRLRRTEVGLRGARPPGAGRARSRAPRPAAERRDARAAGSRAPPRSHRPRGQPVARALGPALLGGVRRRERDVEVVRAVGRRSRRPAAAGRGRGTRRGAA